MVAGSLSETYFQVMGMMMGPAPRSARSKRETLARIVATSGRIPDPK